MWSILVPVNGSLACSVMRSTPRLCQLSLAGYGYMLLVSTAVLAGIFLHSGQLEGHCQIVEVWVPVGDDYGRD